MISIWNSPLYEVLKPLNPEDKDKSLNVLNKLTKALNINDRFDFKIDFVNETTLLRYAIDTRNFEVLQFL